MVADRTLAAAGTNDDCVGESGAGDTGRGSGVLSEDGRNGSGFGVTTTVEMTGRADEQFFGYRAGQHASGVIDSTKHEMT